MDDDALPYQLARTAQLKAIRARRRRPAARSLQPTAWAQPLMSPSQKTGHHAEDRACAYLQAQGLIMLGRNLRSKTGEIDLVANDHGTLTFIEVRHRASPEYGGAAASVNRRKQQRLAKTANYFLPTLIRRFFHGKPPPCRFDVICVEPAGLDWIRDAFDE